MRVRWIVLLLMAAMACESPPRCEVTVSAQLRGAAAPSDSEMAVLLREAETRSRLPAMLAAELHQLRVAMAEGSAEDRCIALRSAQGGLRSVREETEVEKNAVALILDLAALSISKSERP